MTALRQTEWDRLQDPGSLAATALAAKARRQRIAAGKRGPVPEAAVPYFARIAADGRQEAWWIVEQLGRVYGARDERTLSWLFSGDPEARDALCYWLLGLTEMTTGDVARACRMGGAGEAAAAMRRHASRTGFPALDLSDQFLPDKEGRGMTDPPK